MSMKGDGGWARVSAPWADAIDPHPRAHQAPAERLSEVVPAGSADLITVGQAFHWWVLYCLAVCWVCAPSAGSVGLAAVGQASHWWVLGGC